ncbi:MAG: AAA-like domain-containing protein [Clostridiales bacterium]|nr:AAA-like domain-containing protein [Clostridiales bacterium]
MSKIFNTTANCIPEKHYMVDLTERLIQIKEMVDRGDYFTINRARQYGKTTTLLALAEYLKKDYLVLRLDFQRLSDASFADESSFIFSLSKRILLSMKGVAIPEETTKALTFFAQKKGNAETLDELFIVLNEWCEHSEKPLVLMIDEVDQASNYQVFLNFLAQLRANYIERDLISTFQSVILAGVYDIKNLKRKFVSQGEPDQRAAFYNGPARLAAEAQRGGVSLEHSTNSPWNVAADYKIDMSFSTADISKMLREYENDYKTGMDIDAIAQEIYDYTAGYPFLVSRICKYLDETLPGTDAFPNRTAAWTKEGITKAVGAIVIERNTLFESLIDKVDLYPDLKEILYDILMNGADISFNPYVVSISTAYMFGFIKADGTRVIIANRIFETFLYNYFLLSEESKLTDIYRLGMREKYQFIRNGELDMDLILERFVVSFDDLYGDQDEKFKEDDGRKYFLLYLRPIINGEGNYYIESRTRNMERTDIIIDYKTKQYVIELKIWHGNAYNTRGENQLRDYLDYYHLDKGYMLSFCFNKKKEIGLKRIQLGDKLLIEAVV